MLFHRRHRTFNVFFKKILFEFFKSLLILHIFKLGFYSIDLKKVYIFNFLIFLILSSFMVENSFAHNVNIFAWVEGKTVYTESYYPDGKMVSGGEIEVYNSEGKLLLKGNTDEHGIFSFEPGEVGDIRIVLSAGMGHRAEITLQGIKGEPQGMKINDKKKSEGENEVLQKELVTYSPHKQSEIKNIKEKETVPDIKETEKSFITTGLTESEIRKIIREELSEQLSPVARNIAKLQENKPGFNEVLGGIGYIVGLMGIVMYFKSRKTCNKK